MAQQSEGIILSAFNGALNSELMEWAVPTPPRIYIHVNVEKKSWFLDPTPGGIPSAVPVHRQAAFEFMGFYRVIKGKSYKVYELVNYELL
jgi:hypothetical protein